jgi:hypothetical protein
VGGANPERSEDAGRVVGHLLHRDRSVRHGGPARAPVVEGGQAVAVGQPVELELPGLDGVAQATDEQGVGSLADLLGPDVEATGAHVLTHPQYSCGRSRRRCICFGVRAQVADSMAATAHDRWLLA